MKILIISDIHGSNYYAKKIKEIVEREKPEKIVLLGDLYHHGPRNPLSMEYDPMKVAGILNDLNDKYKENFIAIRGNCDAEVDEMISYFKLKDNVEIELNSKKVFFTHGHRYNKADLPSVNIDLLIYGHVHYGFIEQVENVICANPGSITLPKNNSKNSYLIFDSNYLELKDIDGNTIEKREI